MTKKKDTMLGWHFGEESRVLRYGDGRWIVVGESHKVSCVPVLCEAGLHASPRVIDALQYAPGPILYRVELRGKIVRGDDKACATERHYLAEIDATALLREFARKCALRVIHLWDAPRVVRDYLDTGDENIRAAAWAAARAAAWAAARDAACAAAWDAAWAAAWAAARDAAWAAARDAAWDGAWDAARDAQAQILEEMALAAIAESAR